jgi:hypothetical protein
MKKTVISIVAQFHYPTRGHRPAEGAEKSEASTRRSGSQLH